MRRLETLATVAVLAAALFTLLVTSAGVTGSSAAVSAQKATFTGYGFDACSAPAVATMQAWTASPYRALGIYIGGANRGCANANLTPSWLTSVGALGFSFLPLYVGLQAPCVAQQSLALISAASAQAQGVAAANDAAARATALGMLAGTPIYFDMEGYATKNVTCTQTVQAFLTGWVSQLHAIGFVAGVYGSAASTIRDMSTISPLPDDAWIANWNGQASVFGDPNVSDSLWADHQRVHQYKGGHKETWGGVTINIDSDYADGAVVGQGTTPTPTPTPPPPPTAGSVGSGDSQATASWPDGAFAASAVVTLTPATPTAPPAGFGAGGYAVGLAVNDASTTPPTPVTKFVLPVTVHIVPQPQGEVPAFSTDGGTTWASLPQIAPGVLPVGVTAGYSRETDGSIDVLTLEPGIFGLLPDVTPPGQPTNVSAHFVQGYLALTWGPAPDASEIVGYHVLLDGHIVLTKSGTGRRAVVHAFHPTGPTVFRVEAVDAAGNIGAPSRAFVVVPAVRPTGLPRPLPRWAWDLYTWQHTHNGKRPAAAPKQTPAWYWTWATWRSAPFRLKTA
jgi:Domain of unknown function (DUF1906)